MSEPTDEQIDAAARDVLGLDESGDDQFWYADGAILNKHLLRDFARALASRAADVPEPAQKPEGEPMGVFGKYVIRKASGRPLDPEACYFVLRLDTDPAARRAAEEYAKHVPNGTLAEDIVMCVRELEAPCSCRSAGEHCARHPTMFSRVWKASADVPERVSEPLTDERISVIMNQHVAAGDRGAEAAMVAAARAVLAAHEASRAPVPERVSEPTDATDVRDAKRYRFLREVKPVEAQAFFWLHSSRKQRDKAIDDAIALYAAPPAITTPEMP